MRDGLRARAFRSAAPATCLDCAASTYRSVSLSRWFSRSLAASVEVKMGLSRWVGRAIGLDVHRDFCVVAICDEGEVRTGARVPSTPEALTVLAESLLASDRVALEVTGSCWEVARILEPHVDRVTVVSPDDTGITQARAKTDRLHARTLARLLWSGELESVWMPDERCRVLRRRLARREQLVRSRSRAKNEVQAVLQRRLQGKPPCTDLFGVKGRRWLAGLELPLEERESVEAGIRHVASSTARSPR